MKNIIKNKKNIVLILLILIIISGIIILRISGFEKDIEFSSGTRIEIYLEKGYKTEDVVSIAKECFPDREIKAYDIEKLNQIIGIKVKDYTEDELGNLKTKISDKYQIDKEKLELYEVSVPEVTIMSIVKPYIIPLVITTILGLIYIGIKNVKKEGMVRYILKTILGLFIFLAIYFSLILIFRLPFGMYTMPIALTTYIMALLLVTTNKTTR